MDYNLLKVFSKVSELGSFTKAAEVLNQPKSRVSRAISRLEDEIGVQLIRRTTRKISLTSIGREFYLNICPLLNGIKEELTRVSNYQEEMSGPIRITAPQDIGQTLLAQAISKFVARYPSVEVQAIITNELLDLTKENIDISFRAGRLKDSSLIQKKLMSVKFVMVCSNGYLEKYGCPSSLKQLEKHRFLSFRNLEQEFLGKDIKIKSIVRSDSFPMLLSMALNGDGIAGLPDYFCRDHLAAGALVQLFPSWKSKAGDIHILHHPSKNTSKAISKFIEIAIE